jgi:hypothetical protein
MKCEIKMKNMNCFQAAFIAALAQRSTRKPSNSKVVLPVGKVSELELTKVIRALDRSTSSNQD